MNLIDLVVTLESQCFIKKYNYHQNKDKTDTQKQFKTTPYKDKNKDLPKRRLLNGGKDKNFMK